MTYQVEAFIEEKMKEGKEGTLKQLIDEEKEIRETAEERLKRQVAIDIKMAILQAKILYPNLKDLL